MSAMTVASTLEDIGERARLKLEGGADELEVMTKLNLELEELLRSMKREMAK